VTIVVAIGLPVELRWFLIDGSGNQRFVINTVANICTRIYQKIRTPHVCTLRAFSAESMITVTCGSLFMGLQNDKRPPRDEMAF